MEDNKRKLYDALSEDYDLGSFEQFSADIADDTKRRKLYDAAIEDYDFGDYDSFSAQLGFGKGASSQSVPVQESVSDENVTPQFEDEPNLDALNERARKSAEKEQRRSEKEAEKVARDAQKAEERAKKEAEKAARDANEARRKMTPQERAKAFNARFVEREKAYAEAHPEEVAAENEAKRRENAEILAEKERASEDVQRFGTGNGRYSFEEAVSAGEQFAEIAPEIAGIDKRLSDFNARYGDLEQKIADYNAGKIQLTPDEYKQMQSEYGQYKKESEGLSLLVKKYDEVLNTEPGREYKETSERLTELANGPKTPESILEYGNEYARLQRNPIYRASLGENAPSEDEIQACALQNNIAYYEEKMKTAKGDDKKMLKQLFSNAKEALYANPWYKKQTEVKIAENQAENERIGRLRSERAAQVREDLIERNFTSKGKTPTAYDQSFFWQYEKGDPELQRLDAAAHMHDDAIREYRKPTKYDESKGLRNVGKGLGNWASDTNTWSFGVEGFAEDIAVVRPVLEKVQSIVGNLNEDEVVTEGNIKALEEQLTPGELAVLDAYFEKVGAVSAKGADTSIGYQIGQGIGDMVTLGIEMIATGGAGGVARTATEKGLKKGLVKLLGKRAYRKAAQSGAGKVALWAASKIPADMVETAVRIPFMPSTYKALGEGSVQLDSDYKVRPLSEYAPEKMWDQYVEQLTEVSNGFAFPLIGKVVKTPGMQKMIKGVLGENGARAMRTFMERGDIKLLDDAMLGSFGGEWEEELLGAVIHSVTDDPNAMRDFFSAEQQLVLLGTLAPLPISRGLAGGVPMAYTTAKTDIAWNRAQRELERAGIDEGRISRLKEVLDNAPVTEAAREVMNTWNDATEGLMEQVDDDATVRGTFGQSGIRYGENARLYDRLAHYFWAAQQKRALGLMDEIEQDRKIEAKRSELEQRYGGVFYHQDIVGGSSIDVIDHATMNGADGNPVDILITSEKPNFNNEYAYVSEDGGRGFVNGMDVTFRGVVPLDEHLARLVMEDAQNAQVQGMVNEAVQGNRSLRDIVEALPEITYNGQKGSLIRATEDGAVFVPEDGEADNIPLTWAELAEANGIEVPDVPTEAERVEAATADVAARYQAQQNIADNFNDVLNSTFNEAVVDTDEGPANVIDIISDTIDPDAGTAQFTVQLPDGRRSVTMSIPIEPVLAQLRGDTEAWEGGEAPAPAAEPVPEETPAEAPAEEPAEETPKIPLDKDGNPIYDAPGVSVEDALADMYTTEGLDEADVDDYIINRAAEAEKGRSVKQGKMSLKEWGAKKKEANRIADFWGELAKFAEENKSAREKEQKEEAARQELIKKYGVDTSKFDLTPQTAEEAVADYIATDKLINLDDAIRETLGRRKDNRVPTELFRHLGAHGILTKNGGLSVADVARDIVGEYGDTVAIEEDEARDLIINMLVGKTKSEIRDTIFNNRLEQARKEQDMFTNEEPSPAPATESEPTLASEPEAEKEDEEETPEALPEDLPEETAEEETEPETPVEESPVAEPEAPAEEAQENQTEGAENKEENPGKSEDNSVTSQEGETKTEAAPESTYGSSNKVVSKDRYEELKKKMLAKIKGQANAGFDPEIFAMGVEMAAYHIEAGARKFVEFAKRMIADLTDAIRPYLKGIYNGARDLPGMEEYKKEMTPVAEVDAIDINADFNTLSDEQDNTDVQQGDGGVSGTETDSDEEGTGGESGAGDESADNGNAEEDNDSGGDEGGSGDVAGEGADESGGGPADEGADATAGGRRRGGRKANDGKSTRKGAGRRGGSRRGEAEGADGVGRDADVEEETEEQKEAKAAKTEQDAYEAEKERIKDNADTNALKKLFDEIKEKLTGITDKFDETRAKLAGQLRAIRERLQDLFSKNVNKSEALAQEKVPYSPVSDPTGEHAIGSVVPSGSADYMRDAIKRLEKEVGKPVAEFVMEELGYSSLDEMFTTADKEKFTGLSSEQVDAVGLAIQQIKTGRIFIVGDMTGVGKGRVGAALIRWGHRHGKKVIFCTEQPNLFTAMYEDINDIGGLERVAESAEKSKGKGRNKAVDTAPVPFIINSASEANITDDEDNVIVRHSNEAQRSSLFTSGKDVLPPLPGAKNKGKTYDFVMTTYSQLQATEEEEEGTSDKVKKKNERNTKGRQRIQWLKRYAKDAVVIMDESHTAAGTESTRGQNALKLVDAAQGVMFMSATFAKTPEAMSLYAVRSSMNEAQISRDQLIRAISDYGIPMQEILSATLYKTGEYVRRERDFDGVKTNWCQPEEIYSASEIETARNLSDYTTGTINDIIDFQRRYVDPIIRRLNKAVSDANQRSREMFNAGITDSFTQISYASTSYAGQVSNVVGMMLFAIKAKKAADMAIEQIKRGEKPVIAVDNTLGAYVDEIEGDVESADFGTVLKKGLAFALKYQMTTKKFVAGKGVHGEELRNKPKEVKGDRVVEKFDSIEDQFGEAAEDAMRELSDKIVTYGKETLKLDLSLSPIDYIKKRIEDAGFKCGEITKRGNALVQNEDGTWTKKPLKHNKKEVIRRFNGGKAGNPLPKEETYDAVIMNRSGATGNSMHASRKFGDQRPRKMIILQAAKDPNNEVQIRGRIDRTGQVHRGEYFYIISPIPAEKKLTMMLRQKLASLDAQSVGTEKVSSNKVEAEDMDNKYGDEVAKEFLAEHQEINLQLDKPIVQVFNRKTREMEWKGRPGLLYDLMKGMQRMTCMEQEMILQELEEAYSQKIEYLNQNGINDLATTTMDLEATTIDKAIMVKGKNNEAMSEFAHDTTIERVEVNVLRKPLRSEDIVRKEKELGVFEKHEKTDSRGEKEEVSYGEYVQSRAQEAAQALREEKRRKQKEAEDKLAEDIRVEFPREDGESETDYEERIYNDNRMANLRSRNEQERVNYQRSLQEQLVKAKYATTYLKPGYVYLVPLNDTADAQTMYGRFMGFKTGKDGRPNSIEAVFATKDSRAQVSIPVVGMKGMIERIANTNNPSFGDLFGKTKYDYESEEARLKAYDVWWDKMIPEKTARSVRYMITGNILQSVGQLKQQRGMIVTFTRKDAETGEITIDKGLLLAEDFDPENFMVRTEITKEDVWNNAGEFRDTISHIAVFRDGDRLRVKFYRDRDSREDLSEHDVNDDEEFKALCEDGQIIAASRDELHAVIPEENAAEALRILYRNYGFTQGHLLILPDSTEKPDRIVPSGKNYDAVINELQPKYHCWSASSCQSEINKLLKTYKMDINNEDVKRKISELVQLRQAYLRKSYCRLDSQDLAWHIVIYEQEIALLERPRPNESPEEAKRRKDERQEKLNIMEAFREELQFREPTKGHMKHFKQGKIELSEIIKTFKEFNKNKENARIAEKVFAVMKKLNVNIFMDENATDDPRKRRAGGRTAGDYLMYNWRFMNEDTIPDQLKADTILHEMCHTMTAYVLEAIDNGATSLIPGLVDAGKQADALYWAIHNNKAFKHNAGEGPTSGTYPDYGTTDTYEMLAETGASAQFRGDLAQVKVAYKEETTTSFGKTRTSFEFTDVTEQENPQGDVMTALEAASDILERMIAGFNEDGYKKVWTGTGYGQMGYREPTELYRTAENLRNPIDRAAAIVKMNEIAGKLGVKFKEDPNLKAKGSFSPKTGEIRINIDAHSDTADLEATLLHEAVAHYGLRNLFKEDWPAVRKKFYEQATDGIKAKVDALAKQHGLSKEVAMEEYIASLAEDGRFDQEEETFWQKVVSAIKRMLHKIGFNSGRLTDEDFRALLYASFVNMRDGGPIESAAKIATYQALRKMASASHDFNPNDDGPDGGGNTPTPTDSGDLNNSPYAAPFYSNAESALGRIKMEKATPEQWLKMLEKEGGLKAGEDKWLGLSDWLKGLDRKTVTKQEVAEYIAQNQIRIEEDEYTEEGDEYAVERRHPGFNHAFFVDQDVHGEPYIDGVNNLGEAVALYNRENEDKIEIQGVEISEDDYDKLLAYGDEILKEFRQINPTRLKYTTEGLDNKREIALWVPSIEPWNWNDNIHFGDAGNGRAIAWARFGDAEIRERATPEEVQAFIDSQPKAGEWTSMKNANGRNIYFPRGNRFSKDFIVENNGRYTVYLNEVALNTEASLEDAVNSLNKTKSSYRPNELKTRRILFIDEIQSKRHQDAREKGYVSDELKRLEKEYDEFVEETAKKHNVEVDALDDVATPEEKQHAKEFNDRISELRKQGGVPAAPFEKNWHELAMKRMLRLAAEEGYDYVAWTTGEQQAERYNIGSVFDSIERDDFAIKEGYRRFLFLPGGHAITVNQEGEISESTISKEMVGKPLSEAVGKEVAAKMAGLKDGESFDPGRERIGGEGMKGFYDDILPRFMNKYGKKWGVSTGDLLVQLNDGAFIEAHAVPVTSAMAESVLRGQPLFRRADTSSLPEDIRKDVEDLETDQETEVLYRRASQGTTAQTAAEMYGDKVRTIRSAVKEVLVDEMAPVDALMDALATESGTKIKDDERVSDMMRETGGKAMQAVRDYDKKFLQPMWSAVGEFRKNTGTSIKDTETYIGLKSGLERNIVLAKRDAKRDYQAEYDAEIDEINQEEKTKKKALDKQLENGKISDVTYAGELTLLQQEMQKKRDDAELRLKGQFADVDAGVDKRFLEYRKKDYSAITAWAETEDIQEAERLAGDYVADMETRAGKDTAKELWKRINAATKETLKFQYEHQILSRQQYQDISKMMEYYVPMRGFSEDTAEDLFNYYVTPQSNDFQATVLTAKGRKTWYEGPLGNIGAMHSSAISQGVKNEAKLALLDAVRRRPKNTIATVTRAWFVKNGQKDANGKDLYDVAYPQIPEGATLAEREAIIEQFEEDMAEAKRNGDAYNSHREVDLHGGVVAFERQAHKNEHIVQVREGGKEYGILINGNPAAAQAINGVRRSNGAGEKFLGYMRSFTRVLSSMFTTFSVPFWVSNFQRDHGQGLTNAFIRNNPGYVGRYIANRIRAAKLFPLILGSETMDNALTKGDPVANLYKQYLDNGGPMGQNRIEDNEYFERQMKRYLSNSAKQGVIKGATAVLNIIGGVGEAIETITRFAVFMTSMESGRPIHESISDAKEISTNFARKGSGRSFSRDELDRMTHADGTKLKPIERGFVSALSVGVEICRATIPFFNAAVQGLENKVTNYREHWGKTLLADSVYLILGFGMKMLLGGAGGDDDKEKYSHTSDYLRRNNILNPLGNGVYAKWALPQEYRVMYALGDVLASAFQKERPAEDLGMDVFGAIMQLSPIGAVTDEVAFSAENKKKAYETLITNASPGIVAPVLESIFNMDFKGARIYNEGFNENLHAYPGWTKALPTTGSEYVAVAKWLNEATGGNDVERGWANINPAIVEHLVESYFSGPYQIVVRLPEAAFKIAKGEAAVRDVPLLNRIILNTNDNQRDAYYSNMYYYFKEKNTEAERIHSEYKGRPKEGKVAEFYQSDNYKYMLIFNKYDKIERELRKASKQMAEKGDKEKQKEYDERLQNIQYQIAKECLDLYFGRNGKEEVK